MNDINNSDEQQAQKGTLLPIYKRPKEDQEDHTTKLLDDSVSDRESIGKRMTMALELRGKRMTVRPFVVIGGNGILKIFDSEAMRKMRYSIELTKYTEDDLVIMPPDEEFNYFRARIRVHDSVFEFMIEDKTEFIQFKNTMMRYFKKSVQRGNAVCIVSE